MNFEYHPHDEIKSAMKLNTDVLRNGTSLKALINAPGFYACFVRSPSGQTQTLESIMDLLPKALLPDGSLLAERWVPLDKNGERQVLFSRKQDKTLAVDGSLHRYTVFSYRVNGQTVELYESRYDRPAQKPYRDITMTISWTAVRYREMVKRLFHGQEERDTGFFEVRLFCDGVDYYQDGLAACACNGFVVPITVEMLRTGCFYIFSGPNEPEMLNLCNEKIYLNRKR